MNHADFPWRSLGALLVDEGFLTETQLELALAEQRRTGRVLGQILVSFGYLSASTLACALTEQHGVELRPADDADAQPEAEPPPATSPAPGPAGESPTAGEPGAWRPLGKLLVESGFLGQTELNRALAEQKQRSGVRLGEILVERGYLTGPALARALAEQHGIDLGREDELEGAMQTLIKPAAPGEPVFEVLEVAYEPSYKPRAVLYETTNFLEAADFACEFVADRQPEALEIQRNDGTTRETVWTYSDSRADAVAAERTALVDTFGFDPARWGSGPRFDQ